MNNLTLSLIFAGLTASVLAILVTALFLHKRSASHTFNVMGATGIIETLLNPEGVVIVNGELWRARSNDARTTIGTARGSGKVRVVGVEAHLLLVELMNDKPLV